MMNFSKIGKIFSSSPNIGVMGAIGTANTGVTATHYGDGRDVTTVLTFTDLAVGTVVGSASKGIGVLLYTFPAGAHIHTATYMTAALTLTGPDKTGTPLVGIGSVIAVGAVAVLSGTATFQDYITGQTAADINGTATVKTTVATAGALTGISINEAAGAKTVHLNTAWAWTNSGSITATGIVTIHWCKMS